MAYQVSKIVRICTYKWRLVTFIRDQLPVHVAERVVNAMVTGNLDYCNSLLHGITAGQLGMIQTLQNTAARLILRRNRRSNDGCNDSNDAAWATMASDQETCYINTSFVGIQISAIYDAWLHNSSSHRI